VYDDDRGEYRADDELGGSGAQSLNPLPRPSTTQGDGAGSHTATCSDRSLPAERKLESRGVRRRAAVRPATNSEQANRPPEGGANTATIKTTLANVSENDDTRAQACLTVRLDFRVLALPPVGVNVVAIVSFRRPSFLRSFAALFDGRIVTATEPACFAETLAFP
jgi:hypothetical protein